MPRRFNSALRIALASSDRTRGEADIFVGASFVIENDTIIIDMEAHADHCSAAFRGWQKAKSKVSGLCFDGVGVGPARPRATIWDLARR